MRKNSLLKKTAWIVLSAVLFGTVAGTVMTGVQIASSGMVSQFFAIVSSDEKLPEQGEELLPEPFPGGNVPGILPEAPAVPAPATDVSQVVEEAMPAVVAVASTAVYQMPDFGFGWFFGGGSQSYEVPSSGSGIIIGENDTELLIVTNNHVVQDTVSLKITFVDDAAVDAAVKGTDTDTDLAVISVPLDQIPQETKEKIAVARLGDSDGLKVGQGVIAIGNALGYGQSVTVGYVSALNREIKTSDGNARVLLQTDAAINPGNSGGALLNMKGEVIGINAAKYSSTEVEGIGYAIPVSGVQDILDELMNRKTRSEVAEEKRGYLGIQGTTVDEDAAAAFGMPKGVYVYKILKDGAAADSQLREKDIITKLDGMTVKSMQELQKFLKGYETGETIELLVQRQEDGQYKEIQIPVTLTGLPGSVVSGKQ
ncbi:MAG: trypsin-like peptidase domain-containing protein [Lachnospiraceae bacterium]|jgi:serine protease Do|nr:MAG: trypsin-like peptidase domain-containing protein [Lachnospiraceae bacterium]